MSQTKEERLAKIHSLALTRFYATQAAQRDVRMQCLEDRRFYSIPGAQWEGDLAAQFENKPKFEVNKVHNAVIRIINEYRNNRITVDFIPKDGTQDDELADTCDGLYRADEQDSGAQEAYDNCFEEGIGGGFGAFRLRACYEDEEDDDNSQQRIRMEPIFDADSCVFFDTNAKRQDKSDATHCFVLFGMARDAYAEKYDDDPATWPKEVTQSQFDWCTPDIVYLSEYYVLEEKTETIRIFRGLDDEDMPVPEAELEGDDGQEKLDMLLATGFREVRQKRVKRMKVHKYIMSGAKILEDCGIIAGKCIPIIPYYAKRWFVDGIERCQGHVRLAKDAQRLANMLRSWLADISSQSPVEKPILLAELVKGYEQIWADDSVKRYPYLPINAVKDAAGNVVTASPVGYTKAPSVPPGMAALLQITEQDLQDVLGNQQAGEEMQPNISGKVVELIQNKIDMQAFIYMDNFAKTMKRAGEVWLSMAKDIMIEDGRKMKTVTADGEVSSATIREPAYDEKSRREYLRNNIQDGSFDVWVDVGPSSSSQRSATVRSLTGLASMTSDEQAKSILLSTAAMNIEGEGLSDLRAWNRKNLVRMGVVKPTDEEAAEMAQEAASRPPDPQVQLANALAAESNAKAQKAQADTVKVAADTEKVQADTAKILSDMDTDAQNRVLELARAMREAQQPAQPQQ
jgi:hypothetical protein